MVHKKTGIYAVLLTMCIFLLIFLHAHAAVFRDNFFDMKNIQSASNVVLNDSMHALVLLGDKATLSTELPAECSAVAFDKKNSMFVFLCKDPSDQHIFRLLAFDGAELREIARASVASEYTYTLGHALYISDDGNMHAVVSAYDSEAGASHLILLSPFGVKTKELWYSFNYNLLASHPVSFVIDNVGNLHMALYNVSRESQVLLYIFLDKKTGRTTKEIIYTPVDMSVCNRYKLFINPDTLSPEVIFIDYASETADYRIFRATRIAYQQWDFQKSSKGSSHPQGCTSAITLLDSNIFWLFLSNQQCCIYDGEFEKVKCWPSCQYALNHGLNDTSPFFINAGTKLNFLAGGYASGYYNYDYNLYSFELATRIASVTNVASATQLYDLGLIAQDMFGNEHYVIAKSSISKTYVVKGSQPSVFSVYRYVPTGYVISKDLLNGNTANIKRFNYEAIIPNNDERNVHTNIKVQFSRDGTTWYDATGSVNSWTSLKDGKGTIDLSQLQWHGVSSFFYRIQFETASVLNSPALKYVELVYDAPNRGENSKPEFTSLRFLPENPKKGETITIIAEGVSDPDYDELFLLCDESSGVSNEPEHSDICNAGPFAEPYTNIQCTATTDSMRIYCALFDGTDYSEEKSISYFPESAAIMPTITPDGWRWDNKLVPFTIQCKRNNNECSPEAKTFYRVQDANLECPAGGYIEGSKGIVTCNKGSACIQKVCFYAEDAGYRSPIKKSKEFKIDKAAPGVLLTFTPQKSETNWFNRDVVLEVACVDVGSGCDVLQYKTERKPYWQIYYKPFEFSESGTYRIFLRATDRSNNISEVETSFGIDKDKPTEPKALSAEPRAERIRLMWQPSTDATSGVRGYNVLKSINDAAFQKVAFVEKNFFIDFNLPEKGRVTYKVVALDMAGNESEESEVFTINIAPGATLTKTQIQTERWFRGPLKLTLDCVYPRGCMKTFFKVDDSIWAEGNEVLISDEGIHTLEFYSVGEDYTIERVHSTWLGIDNTPPQVYDLNVETSAAGIHLFWSASENTPPGVRKFLIYRDNVLIGETTETSFLDENAPLKNKYNYRVIAIDDAGNEYELNKSIEVPGLFLPEWFYGLLPVAALIFLILLAILFLTVMKIKIKLPFLHREKKLGEEELPLIIRRREFPSFEEQAERPSPFLPAEEREPEIFPLIETELEQAPEEKPGKKEVEKVKKELQKALEESTEEKKTRKKRRVSGAPARLSLDERIERLKKELGIA
jgi:fibronectin type 3 domain-containing protein